MNLPSSMAGQAFHSFKIPAIEAELETNTQTGLSGEEAKRRLGFYGPNQLPVKGRTSMLTIIVRQMLNPLVFILIAAALASIAIGDSKDALFICAIILLNTALGAYQENNAEKSASSLQQMLKIKARVRREGKEKELASEDLVPGDVVLLESGLKVPADLRLFEMAGLEIDESFLTGESLAAQKKQGELPENVGVAERTNMAFAGATVLVGRGAGLVVGTGTSTQVGQIAENVSTGESAKPPLLLRMEKFIHQITIFVFFLSLVVGALLYFQGMPVSEIFFFVVALAVAVVPEGLPVALTVALSIATKRMAKRNVIVRKLTSVESLGSCTVIASDKTGTLTVNEQTAKLILLPDGSSYTVSGEGYNGEGSIEAGHTHAASAAPMLPVHLQQLLGIAVIANEASLERQENEWVHMGDAMDVALLGMAIKGGIEPDAFRGAHPLVDKIPYESERKFSAGFAQVNNETIVAAKGAVETILEFCTQMATGDAEMPIEKESIVQQAAAMAAKGYRVLAFAKGQYPHFVKKEGYTNDEMPPLTFFGLVCFIDPLRPEARQSVLTCKKAGIKVMMITGDHPATAGTIAHELGIATADTPVVTGQMLADAGPSDSPAFEKLVASTTVFARVSPIQKLEIVDVLIKEGEFVAVTGDGVNDAPALKRANIGVAMGSGTDVAKEVGSMIVIDDNFSSIVAGVEEGRFAYDNVRKVIYLLISTGGASVIIIIGSILAGLPLPFVPVQLLWLNIVTNGIQDVALAFEGGEPGAMMKPPRRTTETIFNANMINGTITAAVTMGGMVFGMWFYYINYTDVSEASARNLILLLFVCLQNFHVFNARSETTSAFRIPLSRNMVLALGVLTAQALHIICMQIPLMQEVLQIEPVSVQQWLYILALAMPILLVMEIFKMVMRRKYPLPLASL
jgi:magnesium-transporting ATPase (P-type)